MRTGQDSWNIEESGAIKGLNVIMQLRKICNHPELIDERICQSSIVVDSIDHWWPPQIKNIISNQHFFPVTQPIKTKDSIPKELFMALLACEHLRHKRSMSSLSQSRLIDKGRLIRVRNSFIQKIRHVCFRCTLVKSVCPIDDYSPLSLFINKVFRQQTLIDSDNPVQFKNLDQMCESIKTEFFSFLIPVTRIIARSKALIDFSFSKLTSYQMLTPIPSIFVPNINNFIADSGKMNQLLDLLLELRHRNKKVLIFTQMSRMINLIETMLAAKKFSYLRLDGSYSIEKRQEVVREFNENPRVMVFISSTRVGGVGINLTSADTVIFFDCDWNPAVDRQAQDRCHRIGQSRDVTVYKLVSRHTIEENILLTSNVKARMDDLVMNEGQFNLYEIVAQTAKSKGQREAEVEIGELLRRAEDEEVDEVVVNQDMEEEAVEEDNNSEENEPVDDLNDDRIGHEAVMQLKEDLHVTRNSLTSLHEYGLELLQQCVPRKHQQQSTVLPVSQLSITPINLLTEDKKEDETYEDQFYKKVLSKVRMDISEEQTALVIISAREKSAILNS